MSNYGKLTPHVFLNAVTVSSVSPWVPIDYNHGGMVNERSISGLKSSTDDSFVVIETRTLVINPLTKVTAADIITTATVFSTAQQNISCVIIGPYTHIRARTIATSGATTVVGVI